jgi:hypothetical protein
MGSPSIRRVREGARTERAQADEGTSVRPAPAALPDPVDSEPAAGEELADGDAHGPDLAGVELLGLER